MTFPILAAASAAAIIAGVILGVLGLRRAPVPTGQSPGERADPSLPGPRRSTLLRRLTRVSRRSQILAGAGLVTGLITFLLTGWFLAVVLFPLAFAGVPVLLSAPPSTTRIDRLEAMEEWTRSLAGVLTVGIGLEQAITATVRSAPAPIRDEVRALVARLQSRWPTEQALRSFADDLEDPTGDLIAANLILAAQRRGAGLADVLEGLADSVADDVRARRAVEADRAKPRATARWVTVITMLALVGLALTGTYVRPYGTPLGQAILAVLLICYAAVLVWLRSMARGEAAPRFLGHPASGRSA